MESLIWNGIEHLIMGLLSMKIWFSYAKSLFGGSTFLDDIIGIMLFYFYLYLTSELIRMILGGSVIMAWFNTKQHHRLYDPKIYHELLQLKLKKDRRLSNVSLNYLIWKCWNASRNLIAKKHNKQNIIKKFGRNIPNDNEIFSEDISDILNDNVLDIDVDLEMNNILNNRPLVIYTNPMYIDILWSYYIYSGENKYKKLIEDISNIHWIYCLIFRNVAMQKMVARWSLDAVNAIENGSFDINNIIEYNEGMMAMEKLANGGKSFDEICHQ